ncbi:conserved hypothetical protein [Parafrankia sp. Ea1.12]|nr:conserved hypothetical protein [Parafrankia sp. Ea1.12]
MDAHAGPRSGSPSLSPVSSPPSPSPSPSSRRLAAPSPLPGPEYTPSAVPLDILLGCARSHARLLEAVARVDDTTARRPSLLPGWTVGHLVTHLARNADSHTGMFGAAAEGRVVAQYPGGLTQRDGGIEAGAYQPADLLLADLAGAVARLERAWDGTHVDVWRGGLGLTAARGATSVADLVFLRWREAEIHLVDLALTDRGGPEWDDLSPAYVEAEWAWSTRLLPERLPAEVTVLLTPGDRPSRAVGRGPQVVRVDVPTLPALRWLTGRDAGDPAWPPLGPWT